MTADKVGELEALLAKAMQGELHAECVDGVWCVSRPLDTPGGAGFAVDGECWKQADAELIAAAVNTLPELLRVYRAWQGAAVGEVGIVQFDVDAYCNEVWTEADTSALAGTRVRLVPDGGQGA